MPRSVKKHAASDIIHQMTAEISSNMRDELRELMPRLWRYGLVLSGSKEDAADLAQSTALRALERAHQFRHGTEFDRWCFTILSSIWKNELRSRAVRRGQGLMAVEDAGLSAPHHGDVNILARQVLFFMTKLPEAQRETMYLVYVEGYSYAEAAKRLDIPIGTVMSRLANGRRKLNEAMADM